MSETLREATRNPARPDDSPTDGAAQGGLLRCDCHRFFESMQFRTGVIVAHAARSRVGVNARLVVLHGLTEKIYFQCAAAAATLIFAPGVGEKTGRTLLRGCSRSSQAKRFPLLSDRAVRSHQPRVDESSPLSPTTPPC